MIVPGVLWLSRLIDSRFFMAFLQILLFPAAIMGKKPKYLIAEGYVAARAGKRTRAKYCFQKAADTARAAKNQSDLRWLQAAEFFLARTQNETEREGRVDPLFESSLEEMEEKLNVVGGVFKAEFIFSGLQIVGILPSSSGKVIDILVNETVVRDLNVVEGKFISRFSFRITRRALRMLPGDFSLSLKVHDGEFLSTMSGHRGLRVHLAQGYGENSPILLKERRIDKKGSLAPTSTELKEIRSEYLEIYRDARDFLMKEYGKHLFLIYGTLLGFVREGDFIPGDDDFDVAFMADAHEPEGAKTESLDMIRGLVSAGFSVSFNRRGRLFRLHARGSKGSGPYLDVHSFWTSNDKVYGHNDFCAEGTKEMYVPAVEQDYGIMKAYIPAEPEAFLAAHYGPNWRIPDPSFVNYYMGKNRDVLKTLNEALISPAEYTDTIKKLESHPGTGVFLSLAARPLYPLPERDEDLE